MIALLIALGTIALPLALMGVCVCTCDHCRAR